MYLASIISAIIHNVREINETDMKSVDMLLEIIILEYWCRCSIGRTLIIKSEAIDKCQNRLLIRGSNVMLSSIKVNLSICLLIGNLRDQIRRIVL